jgi:ATP-binding cassette subfamily G (WHITE) protein 2 (PDR)
MGQLCISFNEIADNAANLAVMLFTMCLNFCGVLAGPDVLPGFWIFMYRCNPFTYLIQGILATGLAKAPVTCSPEEYVSLVHPLGQTCQEFLALYISVAGGYISDPSSTTNCNYCQMKSTDAFLKTINASYGDRCRNFGIFNAFTVFNIIMTVFFYWLLRVPKGTREKKGSHKG